MFASKDTGITVLGTLLIASAINELGCSVDKSISMEADSGTQISAQIRKLMVALITPRSESADLKT